MIRNAKYWVDQLNLLPHPEGGFYKETYRSQSNVDFVCFSGKRSVSTGIYFLLTKGNFSAFHRIKSDEMWHFYSGDPIDIFILSPEGNLGKITLGLDLESGQTPQAVVPSGTWFASQVKEGGDHGLVGCTVAPGFDFDDFEMAKRDALIQAYPNHKNIISSLTRD